MTWQKFQIAVNLILHFTSLKVKSPTNALQKLTLNLNENTFLIFTLLKN